MNDFYNLDLNTRKLCSQYVYANEKYKKLLLRFYNSLNINEQEQFKLYSERFIEFVHLGAKKYKITKNSIIIAIRLFDDFNIACYPFIDKIVTKGWGTSDGTFSWSMRLLDKMEKEIYSFEPASMFVSKKYELSICSYNGFTVIGAD